jgi:putative solute:sodium symporter small subunit
MNLEPRRRRYWRINLCVIHAAMLLGFVATFVVSFFARELDFVFLGWPFSFWVAAQGSLLVYLFIVAGYAWVMNRLDRREQEAGAGQGGVRGG